MSPEQTWEEGRAAVEERIISNPRFPELVRCYGGKPSSHVPSTRASRLAAKICVDLELEPGIWKGNVFGAAATYITTHSG